MPDADRCVCCGEIIPEGRQVCPQCERKRYIYTIPDIPPSLNKFAGRENQWEYRKLKKEWAERVCWLCRPKPEKPYDKAKVTLIYFFPDNRRRDPDNYNGKMILDGLTKAGIISDDSFNHIELCLRCGGVDRRNPRVEIEVEEL